MIRLSILYLLLNVCFFADARVPSATDSLGTVVEKAGTNREKADLLFEAGDRLSAQDTINAVRYIYEGLAYVSGDTYYQGVGYFYLGRVYMDFARPKAEAAFEQALAYLQQINTPGSAIYQSRAWANKAVLAQLNGDNETYINLFLDKAIPLAGKGGDSLRVADCYANVAIPFMNYGEYDKAILYLHKAADLFQRLAPEDLRRVDVYSYLAKIYTLQDSMEAAGTSLRLAYGVLKADPESLYAPNYHGVEAMYLIKQRHWGAAAQSVEKGLAVARKLNNRYDIRQLLYQKAGLLAAQQKWTQARAVLLDIYEKGYVEFKIDQKQLFADLANIDRQLGNDRGAYEWMEKQAAVAEQVYNEQTKAQIADLEARYNFVQQEKELLIAREKAKRQQGIVFITVIAFLLAMVAVYFWLRNRRQQTARQIQELKQQQRIELGKALLAGEERERGRLARDLHDGLGGMLAGIKLNLSQMVAVKEWLGRDDLAQTVERLGYSVSELRRIARNMMPESLLQSGLEVALKDLCEDATLPGIKVSFRAFDVREQFAPQVQVMIYRIVQELIYNALKHAEASRVMVQCSQSEGVFFITVEDNGKGFCPDTIPTTSQGLKNIRSRIGLLQGKMDIESGAEGTNINIELYVGS